MQTLHVPIVIEQDEDGAFIVSAPTLKGCHSYGLTIDEAVQNIREAVFLCLEEESVEASETALRFVGVRDLEVSL